MYVCIITFWLNQYVFFKRHIMDINNNNIYYKFDKIY